MSWGHGKHGKNVMTFEKATKLLGAKDKKKVFNNTYLERCEGRYRNTFWEEPPTTECIALRFHSEQIVKIFPNKTWQLFMGGWDTPITRNRIDDFTPARVLRGRGTTYIVNTIDSAVDGDPIREFILSVDKNEGKPALPWIVKWSGFGIDPIRAAWNASSDLLAMTSLIESYGDSTYRQLIIPGIDIRLPPKKYKAFAAKMMREVQHRKLSTAQAIKLLRKFTKPPVLKEVMASNVHYVGVCDEYSEYTEFYEGMIIDASGREVKS